MGYGSGTVCYSWLTRLRKGGYDRIVADCGMLQLVNKYCDTRLRATVGNQTSSRLCATVG